jgi:hypothetical protein
MEILRVPPYPLVSIWEVPEADKEYLIYVEDLVDHSSETSELTSNEDSQIEYILPKAKVEYDREFLFRVIDPMTEEIVVDSNLTVYRPYIDPNILGNTEEEVEEYKELEIVARKIIDSYCEDGFYNHKLVIQHVGQGTDYFPVWHSTSRVLKVYENDILVYDVDDTETDWKYVYKVMLDNSAIYRYQKDPGDHQFEYNRMEYNPTKIPTAIGDLGFYGRSGQGVAFPRGYDYTFVLDAGYKAIPPEIELAAKYLIRDLKDSDNDYYKRFITHYQTDQFTVKFDSKLLGGTGNMIVDKILDNYKGKSLKPGLM